MADLLWVTGLLINGFVKATSQHSNFFYIIMFNSGIPSGKRPGELTHDSAENLQQSENLDKQIVA